MAKAVIDNPGSQPTASASARRAPLTNLGEIWAYVAAALVIFALNQALLLSGLEVRMFAAEFRAGGVWTLRLTNLGLGVLWNVVLFLLFLAARGLFRGAPAAIVGSRGSEAVRSCWREVGAYALSKAVGMAIIYVFGAFVLVSLFKKMEGYYGSAAGSATASIISIIVSSTISVLVFVLFLHLRRIFMRAAFEQAATVATARIDPAIERPDLVGLGGWLILPAIGLVAEPILGAGTLVYGIYLFPGVADAGYGGALLLELFVHSGFTIFVTYAAILFFRKSRRAPGTIISLLIAGVLAQLILVVVEASSNAPMFAVESGKQLLAHIVGAAIWIPYFRGSIRVRQTFIH